MPAVTDLTVRPPAEIVSARNGLRLTAIEERCIGLVWALGPHWISFGDAARALGLGNRAGRGLGQSMSYVPDCYPWWRLRLRDGTNPPCSGWDPAEAAVRDQLGLALDGIPHLNGQADQDRRVRRV